MECLTDKLKVIVIILVGVILGIFLAAYINLRLDSYLESRNSQYITVYWSELKAIASNDTVEVIYIKPKVFKFLSLTPYFIADLNLSKMETEHILLSNGWQVDNEVYSKMIDGTRFHLSLQEHDKRVRIRIEKVS